MSGLHIEDLSLSFLTSPPSRHTKLLRMTRGTRRTHTLTVANSSSTPTVRHTVEPASPWNGPSSSDRKDLHLVPEIDIKWHSLFANLKSFVPTLVFGPCAVASFWDAERLAQTESSAAMNPKPATDAATTTSITTVADPSSAVTPSVTPSSESTSTT
jgi:hypothetical protein